MAKTKDIRKGLKIVEDGVPYVIVTVEFTKPGKGAAFNTVRKKNMISGSVVQTNYKSDVDYELADVNEVTVNLSYKEGESLVFMDPESYEEYRVDSKLINAGWIMNDVPYRIVFFNGNPIEVKPPITLEMTITETSPAVKGNTVGNATKHAVTETGYEIQVPLFIENGQKIKINTETEEYLGKA